MRLSALLVPLACALSLQSAHRERSSRAALSAPEEASPSCPFDGDCGPNCIGTEYGGWQVPFAVRQFLQRTPNKVIYSFGVGEDVSFDVGLACKFDMHMKLYDPSPAAKSHFNHVAAVVGKGYANDAADRMHPVAGTNPSDVTTYWRKIRMTPIKSSDLEMHDLGVGSEDGNLTFYHSRNQAAGGSWSLDPGMRGPGGSTITVPIRTIEHILGDDTPAAVKLDVEGMENDILKSLLQKGKASPPVIFVDFDSICCCMGAPAYCARKKAEGQAMVGQLQAAGYQLFQTGGDYTFWRPPQQ